MNKTIIEFFKEMGLFNLEYFKMLEKNTTIIDKNYEEIKEFVGFYPGIFKLVLPKIKTTKDIIIWIHEYTHALFPDCSDEILPNLMEAYFINKYITDKKEKEELIEKTKLEIEKSNSLEHTIAKKIKLNTITNNKML